MANFFAAYDSDGNSSRLEEYVGTEEGFIFSKISGGVQAIKIATSTYIGVDGKVYSTSQSKSKEYTTPENIDWAKREMLKRGWVWQGSI